jgi:hypothetical protein
MLMASPHSEQRVEDGIIAIRLFAKNSILQQFCHRPTLVPISYPATFGFVRNSVVVRIVQ